MKKIAVVLGLFLIAGGGCSVINNFGVDRVGVKDYTPSIHYFDSELFSLDTPVVYNEFSSEDGGEGSLIAPDNKGYPEILFYVKTGKVLPNTELLAQEEERLKTLREQVEGDGEIVENKEVYFSGQKGARTVVQYRGRSLEDDGGYIREFIYSFFVNGNEFRFWVSATDQEDPDKVAAMFDGIMKTIQFK